MRYERAMINLVLALVFLPVLVEAQEEDRKVGDAGIGFALSTKGQSLFYTRGTNPFRTNHGYFTVGCHQEQHGINVGIYDPYTGRVIRNPNQSHYLEFGGGWRRLWFQDKLAEGFFPHTMVELGASGYVVKFGRFRNYLRETSLSWSPYWQAGLGASIHTGTTIYRLELGYLATLIPIRIGTFSYAGKGVFSPYRGVFFKVIISSGQKPR